MKIVVLTGGVGGAKLVLGLAQVVAGADLTAIVNTGDDFAHLGLHVSPDIDTLLYTLAGKANAAQGWGREGESWGFMAALRELGGEDWFQLGDGDLALHVLRTRALAVGQSLSTVTADFARAWGIAATVMPMSDDPVRTIIDSEAGPLEFQRYFVEQRCAPVVRAIRFDGAARAAPAPGAVAAFAEAGLIVIAPSNPFLSVDPLLAVPGLRAALAARRCPAVVVSPLIGGRAVKGPTAKLMAELGLDVSNEAIAAHYGALVDGMLIDSADDCAAPAIAIARTATMMQTIDDKARVARAAIALGGEIGTTWAGPRSSR